MDVERMESHVAKWLSDNCVDTNATVLQNARLFMDHVSNVYKGKVALYPPAPRSLKGGSVGGARIPGL